MIPDPLRCASNRHRPSTRHAWLLACAVALLGAAYSPRAAESLPGKGTSDLVLERQVIAAGGGRMDGGEYRIVGTIGQVDADVLHPASGGAFGLVGGFWASAIESTPAGDVIFRDGFED